MGEKFYFMANQVCLARCTNIFHFETHAQKTVFKNENELLGNFKGRVQMKTNFFLFFITHSYFCLFLLLITFDAVATAVGVAVARLLGFY